MDELTKLHDAIAAYRDLIDPYAANDRQHAAALKVAEAMNGALVAIEARVRAMEQANAEGARLG